VSGHDHPDPHVCPGLPRPAGHAYVLVQVEKLHWSGDLEVTENGPSGAIPGCLFLHLPTGPGVDVVLAVETTEDGSDGVDELIDRLYQLRARLEPTLNLSAGLLDRLTDGPGL
jgi:hypothetical protein